MKHEKRFMEELIFLVEHAPEGGYIARALGASIFTEAEDLEGLRGQVRDAVRCHFEEGQGPRVIRYTLCMKKSSRHESCLATFRASD